MLLTTAALFVVNVFVPDALPFVDEILMALATVLLARLKRSKTAGSATNTEP